MYLQLLLLLLLLVGYVSRVSNTNPSEHVILATQFFKPKDFAAQINLNLLNIWGIVKMICELLMSKEDGKYVLMKDPNKPIVSDDDSDDDDDDDDDDDSIMIITT
jgi:translation initiation factor 3 subunit D